MGPDMKRVSLTLPGRLLKRLDEQAAKEKRTRSNMIQVALEFYLDQKGGEKQT
jgi:metal-responsive CopG/Arc/MetJ family transcriptional regulator